MNPVGEASIICMNPRNKLLFNRRVKQGSEVDLPFQAAYRSEQKMNRDSSMLQELHEKGSTNSPRSFEFAGINREHLRVVFPRAIFEMIRNIWHMLAPAWNLLCIKMNFPTRRLGLLRNNYVGLCMRERLALFHSPSFWIDWSEEPLIRLRTPLPL